MDIYIHKNGENLGPFTLEQVKERLARNDFTSTDHAWHEGLEGWIPLEDLLVAVSPPETSVPHSIQPSNHGERATIYIVRGDIELGPYTVDEINTHLKTGVFKTSDVAKHSGSETLWPLPAIPGVGSSALKAVKRPDAQQQVHPRERAADPAYAGFWVRAVAEILDGFAMYLPHLAIKIPLLYILKAYSDTDDPAVALGVILLSLINSATLLVMYWLYYAISESSSWQATVGKKLLGLQVVDLDGRRLTFKRASGRFFAKLLSVFTLGFGYIMAGFTARKQALHDLMAGTLVVKGAMEASQTQSPSSLMPTKAQPEQKPHVGSNPDMSLIVSLVLIACVAGFIALLALRREDHAAPQTATSASTADSKSGTPSVAHSGTPGAASTSRPEGKLPTAVAEASQAPASTRSELEEASEKSPLGDLIVWHSHEQSGEGEIWLDCADDSRRTAQLCDYDARSGQVSFSPDEGWIVVTDGGGPGSSLGTELRAFRREYQNVYTEIPDAGIANKAAEAVLRRRHAPESVELVHVYAQGDGWSEDGTKLKFRVWADDGRQPGYRLEPTAVTYDLTGLQGRQPTASVPPSHTQDDSPPSSQTQDSSTMQADRDRADAELNDIYKRLMAALNSAQQEQLRVGERTWIKARDAQADSLARGSTASGSDYQANDLWTLTELTRKRTQALTAMLENIRTASSAGLQKRLPNGGVADPYANYTSVHPSAAQTPRQPSAALSRVYTVPELKSLAGTRPTGVGLRGDFVLVKQEGSQVLLQSRAKLRNFGITLSTNGRDAIYRGNTFVTVNCSKDMSRFISGQLVTIPAEQPLQIISVSQNNQGQINVEASF